MTPQAFSGQIEKSGARAFIALPFDPQVVWGARARHHISGTVDGVPIRGPLAAEGTRWILPLGPAWLRDHPLPAGAAVAVVLAPEGPQSDRLAEDIAAALEAEPRAKAFFDSLPTFYRKNYLRWIDSAKRPATRAAHISGMVALLKEGKRER